MKTWVYNPRIHEMPGTMMTCYITRLERHKEKLLKINWVPLPAIWSALYLNEKEKKESFLMSTSILYIPEHTCASEKTLVHIYTAIHIHVCKKMVKKMYYCVFKYTQILYSLLLLSSTFIPTISSDALI